MTKLNQIKVITSVERRRRWSAEDKKAIVEQTYQPGMSVSLIARKYDISPSHVMHPINQALFYGSLMFFKNGHHAAFFL
jgi:transposase-like protein